MHYRTWALAAVGLATGCLDPSDRGRPHLVGGDRLTLEIIPSADPPKTDPATVRTAEVSGDELVIDLQFGGGCRPHLFGIYTDGNVGLSNPPFVMLYLLHEANGDLCEALLSRRLRVDLRPLQELLGPGGVAILRLVEPHGEPAQVPELLYRY